MANPPAGPPGAGGRGLHGRPHRPRHHGPTPVPVGSSLDLVLEDVGLPATVVRSTTQECALSIEDSFAARAAMIRIVYSGRHNSSIEKIEPLRVVAGLFKRVFR
jgi:hypothetical protein